MAIFPDPPLRRRDERGAEMRNVESNDNTSATSVNACANGYHSAALFRTHRDPTLLAVCVTCGTLNPAAKMAASTGVKR